MKRKRASGKKSRAGTAIVETALSLLLFTSILFSLFDFGYVLYLHQTLANRVQSAARYGSLNPTDTTGMRNLVLYNQTTGTGTGLFGLTTSNVTAVRAGSGTSADRVTVTISGFAFKLIAPGISNTAKNISASAPVEPN